MVALMVLVGLAVLAAFAALHWYAWRRLVRDTTAGPGFARRAGTVVFVAAPLMMFAALVAERTGAPFLLQQVLAWPGFMWLALSLYLLLALVVGELVRPLLRRWLEREGTVPEAEAESVRVRVAESEARDPAEAAPEGEKTAPAPAPAPASAPAPEKAIASPSRRLFVSRIVGGTAAAVAAGTVGYGTYGVLRGPKVKRVTVPLAKLPRAAHGFRIAVVSDIHLGPILGRDFTRRVVDTVNATQPDLIAVVGDLVDGSVEHLAPAAAPLAGMRARHGAYFVTGNHEYFSGAEQWVDHVRELGLHPLRNARTELPGFDLAGVDDVAGEDEGKGPDFAKALGGRDRSRASVLLAHQPVVIHDAVEHGVDLQLSGHTHGGQLWPGNLIADLANPTLAGLERYGDTQLYVTRGAGAWGPPVRVGAPSDITVVELASRQA
ncbi:metallophosphoesterase [Streptomyces sp. Je 1-369]|uniref:metallophosphoesterase n=1 Tax=Streptomyces sp. Je 1-369 TaxID=2966192 RepID=UPI0022865090|nr:metallophosphoesterase [Streptomyces sp. Je 1-369]WAL97448.1 metallophosphoesterase [Streptomyces sp. Je 1-369]